MSDFLSDVIEYADNFAYVTRAAIKSIAALQHSREILNRIGTSTYRVQDKANAVRIRNQFDADLRRAGNQFQVDVNSNEPFRYAIKGLADWVEERTGQTFDEFLTANNLTVFDTFAQMSDRNISESNIREE